jgi:hypothetical protein
MYDGKLPIVVTSMKQLKEHGPAGAVFRRFGRPHNQTLLEAIGNQRHEAHDARQRAEYAARERERKEELRRVAAQEKAEREARRPVCADCDTRFSDERGRLSSLPGGAPARDSPAPVRRLQAARHHRRSPCPAAPVRAPGAARAASRGPLVLSLPNLMGKAWS